MKTYAQVMSEGDKKLLAFFEHSDAHYFMRELMDQKGLDLYTNLDNFVDDEILTLFNDGIMRLINNEPLAHILGYSWFYNRKFSVNSDVLIPRPETEILVEKVLKESQLYFDEENISILDLACGSGAIGITLKLEEPQYNVSLSDISKDALVITNSNKLKLNADVDVYESDMLQTFINENIKFDVIVSNPPYILNNEQLEASVYDYEPHLALFGGEDGLDFYRIILEESKKVLKDKAMIAFEIGYDQKESLTEEIRKHYPNASIKYYKDYADLDRMIFIFI